MMIVAVWVDCAKRNWEPWGCLVSGWSRQKGKDGEESPPHRWMVPPAKGEERRAMWRGHLLRKPPKSSKRKRQGRL